MTPASEEPFRTYESMGLEDPRITALEGMFYIMYTAVSPYGPRLSLARTKDFRKIERVGLISRPENKDGVLFYIAVEKKDNITLGTNYSQSSTKGIKSEYVCSYELFQLYDSTDIRLTSYITTSNFEGNTYNHIEKFRGRSSSVEEISRSTRSAQKRWRSCSSISMRGAQRRTSNAVPLKAERPKRAFSALAGSVMS